MATTHFHKNRDRRVLKLEADLLGVVLELSSTGMTLAKHTFGQGGQDVYFAMSVEAACEELAELIEVLSQPKGGSVRLGESRLEVRIEREDRPTTRHLRWADQTFRLRWSELRELIDALNGVRDTLVGYST